MFATLSQDTQFATSITLAFGAYEERLRSVRDLTSKVREVGGVVEGVVEQEDRTALNFRVSIRQAFAMGLSPMEVVALVGAETDCPLAAEVQEQCAFFPEPVSSHSFLL